MWSNVLAYYKNARTCDSTHLIFSPKKKFEFQIFMIFDEKQNSLYKQALLSKVGKYCGNLELFFFEIMRWVAHFLLNFQIKKVKNCYYWPKFRYQSIFCDLQMYLYLKKTCYERKIVPCSPNPTTNSETTNPNPKQFVLTNLNKFHRSCKCLFIENNPIAVKNSGFVFLELVVGFGPSYIYSCSIGHILEHEFCHLGCRADVGQ